MGQQVMLLFTSQCNQVTALSMSLLIAAWAKTLKTLGYLRPPLKDGPAMSNPPQRCHFHTSLVACWLSPFVVQNKTRCLLWRSDHYRHLLVPKVSAKGPFHIWELILPWWGSPPPISSHSHFTHCPIISSHILRLPHLFASGSILSRATTALVTDRYLLFLSIIWWTNTSPFVSKSSCRNSLTFSLRSIDWNLFLLPFNTDEYSKMFQTIFEPSWMHPSPQGIF